MRFVPVVLLLHALMAVQVTASLFSWMALPFEMFEGFEGFEMFSTVEEWQAVRNYGIVVDAGSSGTRLLVYSWVPGRAAAGSGLPLINKAFPDWASDKESFLNISPGLSSLASFDDPPSLEATAEYLRPLLDFAKAAVPEAKHESTPLYFLATAGMRLVQQDRRDALMLYACRAVRLTSTFDVSSGCDTHFRIITGEEEGLYGWIAVNYLNSGFADTWRQSPLPPHQDSPSTYGFLDMGGASTQFAFEPIESMKKEHAQDLKHVQLRTVDGRNMSYHIFVSTFLGFGVNEARRRYVEGLAEDAGLLDPGAVEYVSVVHDPCLPDNLALKSDKYLAHLVGTGSLQQCLAGLHPYLRKQAPCEKQPCLFDGVSAPIADFTKHRFIGVSEYYYTPTSVPGAVTHGGAYHFSEFAKNAELVCQGPYNVLQERYMETNGFAPEPGSVEENRLQLQCFKSAWVLEILHDGFGIPREHVLDEAAATTMSAWITSSSAASSKSPFEPANELNGFKISWTLGAMLLHVSSLIEPHA
ncbi:UNVERIFIED_CONTAM: Golgi apyrase [Siphonaria sp. JEL0065]|nr:Golgi apyrase [Siphonaria sp. JEL0065]